MIGVKPTLVCVSLLVLLSTLTSFGEGVPRPGRVYRGPEFAAKLHEFDQKYQITSRGLSESGFVNRAVGVFSEPLDGRDPFEVALQFLEENKELFGMRDPRKELARWEGGVSDKRTGETHARFRQSVSGIRVWASNVSAHFDRSGRMTSVESSYVLKPAIVTKARLTEQEALDVIQNAKKLPQTTKSTESELLIHGDRLVWRIIIAGPAGGGEYLVGADDGQIISYDNMRRYLAPPNDLAIALQILQSAHCRSPQTPSHPARQKT